MVEVIFQIDKAYKDEVDSVFIKKALQLTLQRFARVNARTITVVVTDSETIRQLNHQYRGFNFPTDVLSFENLPDPDFPDMDQGHLGDVLIAYPVAKNQAQAAGHSPMAELILLAVHGTLHLLGFDHETLASKDQMWTAQHQIMAELGLNQIQPTED